MSPPTEPKTLALLGTQGVLTFADLFNKGHRVYRREIAIEGDVISARLFMAKNGEKLTLQGQDHEFLRLALAFVRFPFEEVPLQFPPGTRVEVTPHGEESPRQASPECRVTFCGIPLNAPANVVVSDAGKEVSIRLWLSATESALANPVSARADLDVRYGIKDGPVHWFKGYVHGIVPFARGGECLIQVEGKDSFAANPTVVEAMFNFKVDPSFGIAALGGFADLELLFSDTCEHEDLAHARTEFASKAPNAEPDRILEVLRAFQQTAREDVSKELAAGFEQHGIEEQTATISVRAFLNALELRLRKEDLVVVVGCVENLRAEGVAEVGRNVLVVAPDHVPFRLRGREDEELCRQWDSESARLVTFVRAAEPQESKPAAAVALRDAADWLMLALADSSWWHKTRTGEMAVVPVDARTQAGRFDLSPYYHWHYLFDGGASQHRYGSRKLTDVALLDPLVHAALSARKPILTFLQDHRLKAEKPETHGKIRSAVEWVVRSRSSLSREEEFVCLWIALEFLVTPGSNEEDVAIKSAMHARVAGLLAYTAGGDRTARKLWNRRIREWYRIRNALVHDGGEGVEDVGKHIPDLRHAAISVILYLVESVTAGAEGSIGDILDAHRKKRHGGDAGPP